MVDILGAHRKVDSLTHRDLQFFVRERLPLGDRRRGRHAGRPIGPRILAYDVAFVQAVMHWAVGSGSLERNPIQNFRVDQKRHTPKRPVLTGPQYDQMLSIAPQVDPQFRLALVLAHETGHRIGAIRFLRWNDVDWAQGDLHWRGEHDKTGLDHRTPLTPTARTALLEAQQAVRAIGAQWILTAPRNAGAPVSRFLAEKWWGRAERLARLAPEPGRGWHSLRWKFATELKTTPIKDLCALGGWKDPKTILAHYQRPDSATMRQALEGRRRLEA